MDTRGGPGKMEKIQDRMEAQPRVASARGVRARTGIQRRQSDVERRGFSSGMGMSVWQAWGVRGGGVGGEGAE